MGKAFVVAGLCLLYACRAEMPAPVESDLAYGPEDSQRADVYRGADRGAVHPLLVLIHGGGWMEGSRKEFDPKDLAQFLDAGFVVVTLDYRLGGEAPAPAAVTDVRLGAAWAAANAPRWGADSQKLVLAGYSAGGHLAMLAAWAPEGTVPGPRVRAAGVASFWGITDVADLLVGANRRSFAARWFQGAENPGDLAARLSPLLYAAESRTTPVVAIHSLRDPIVPVQQSQLLLQKVREAGGQGELIEMNFEGHAARGTDREKAIAKAIAFFRKTGVL